MGGLNSSIEQANRLDITERSSEPIAIIGMGCRYPQAKGLDALWKLLVEGRDALDAYSEVRFRELDDAYAKAAAARLADEKRGQRLDSIATDRGGFLPDVDKFDAAFFGISPREAGFIDPQQRLLLEVSWEALEDAGQVREQYRGSRTGVFTGLWTTDYENHIFRNSEKPEFYLLTGGGRSTACGRISFTFGFEGPSISVDTACSSSMVAIHLACQSLRQGESEMALAGGVNVILSTDFTRLFTSAGMLSPDGRCKFGDASANGFVRSEGAGMVVLKRLSDAVAAGDGIYAVIRGSAVNNDGRSGGLLVTPSREGQRQMLIDAWRQAGIRGTELSYIEAHGTGTHVGDPVEIGAIADALIADGFDRIRISRGSIPIGSMKSNIGHTESAAGVGGVIKAALVLERGFIPASLHCIEPNPEIDWANGPVEMVTESRPLRTIAGKARLVGASSFGLTGTNAHMVLAEHVGDRDAESFEVRGGYLLPLSAFSETALKGNALRWAEFLRRLGEEDLGEACYLAGARRTHLAHRVAFLGNSCEGVATQLEIFAGETGKEALETCEVGEARGERVRVVFVAPGQGSQWEGMARELLIENPAFRHSFEACERAIAAETGWSLIERLTSTAAGSYLNAIDFVQPALFAMSVALAAAWRAVGVTPEAVIGHSMGEVAAAHLAGALTLEDAARVICRRSRLMRRLSGAEGIEGTSRAISRARSQVIRQAGAMASVDLGAEEMKRLLAQAGHSGDGETADISIAAFNSPGTTVISGRAESIDSMLEWLELKEIFCRRIKVDVASHSAMVEPILEDLKVELAEIEPRDATLAYFSTVDSGYAHGRSLDADYWVRNLRQPVRFTQAVSALADEGLNCFIELSPHPVLVPAIDATLRAMPGAMNSAAEKDAGIALPSLLRSAGESESLLRSIARYWINGGKLDWDAVAGRVARGSAALNHRLRLPLYAFERERFWPEESEEHSGALRGVNRGAAGRLAPLIRGRIETAHEPGMTLFEVIADLEELPFLSDHKVGGAIVFPAAAHIEAALESAALIFLGSRVTLKDVQFLQALYLTAREDVELQLSLRRIAGREDEVSFSLRGRLRASEGEWTEHSSGTIRCSAYEVGSVIRVDEIDLVDADSTRRGSGEEHYRMAAQSGLEYGPAFQLVESFESAKDSGDSGPAKAKVRLLLEDMHRDSGYAIHPALLDCCFQAMVPLRSRIVGMVASDVYLPVSVRSLAVIRKQVGDENAWGQEAGLIAEASLVSADRDRGAMEFDLRLKTAAGSTLAVIDGLRVQRVKAQGGDARVEHLYEMGWKSLPAPPQATPGGSAGRHWLIFSNWAAGSFAEEAESGGRSYQLAHSLAKAHTGLAGRCTVVWPGERFRALGAGERRLDLLGADEYEVRLEDAGTVDQLLRLVTAEAGCIRDVIDLRSIADSLGEFADKSGDMLSGFYAAQNLGVKALPFLIQGLTRAGWASPPRLWLVTAGTQRVVTDEGDSTIGSPGNLSQLAGATVWGLGAAMAREQPELRPVLVDLSAEPKADEVWVLARLITNAEVERDEPGIPREDRLALRVDQVFGARLRPCLLRAEVETPHTLGRAEAFRIAIERPGSIEQLQLRAIEDVAPQSGEVSIDVSYAGLNFIDVTKALGIYPGMDLGIDAAGSIEMGGECSGRVVAIGEGVDGFCVGDEVVALTSSPTRVGLLRSKVNLPERLVLKKPKCLSEVESSAVPIAYLTAHYSLNELARIRAGEWVLIHAGAGGVGLCAAKIALEKGARVIATASSAEKHEFLYRWGVEHVLQSRTLEFADRVMEITAGRGVDVVLNSLAGDFIVKSLEVLAPYGRFVELGKKDIYEDRRVGLKAFRQNIAYFAVDLAALIEDRPAYAAEMFGEVMRSVGSGLWAVPPVKAFAASEAASAFETMMQGKHIGKLTIDFQCARSEHETWRGAEYANNISVRVLPVRKSVLEERFKRDAAYLITGGLGGVGIAVSEWMAANGAGHLVLVSRRTAGADGEEAMIRMRALGATVEHRRVDLLDATSVAALVKEIEESGRRLCGVMHAAAVIDDALVMDLAPERFDPVFGPKIRGTWNLHRATIDLALDFFVLFSSFASIFPQPGHGSYSAANSFMDAFAGYRRSLGLVASSINWAGWLGLGLAREVGTSRTIAAYEREGFGSFDREEALYLLGQAIEADPVHAAAVRIDSHAVRASFDGVPALFAELAEVDPGEDGGNLGRLAGNQDSAMDELKRASSYGDRKARLEGLLRAEASRVLKLAPERIGSHQPFGQMGIDSLMALELIRRVNGLLGTALPATAVFNYPTLTELAAQILKRLGLAADSESDLVPLSTNRGDKYSARDIVQNAVLHRKSRQAFEGHPAKGSHELRGLDELSDEDALQLLIESSDGLGR